MTQWLILYTGVFGFQIWILKHTVKIHWKCTLFLYCGIIQFQFLSRYIFCILLLTDQKHRQVWTLLLSVPLFLAPFKDPHILPTKFDVPGTRTTSNASHLLGGMICLVQLPSLFHCMLLLNPISFKNVWQLVNKMLHAVVFCAKLPAVMHHSFSSKRHTGPKWWIMLFLL